MTYFDIKYFLIYIIHHFVLLLSRKYRDILMKLLLDVISVEAQSNNTLFLFSRITKKES